RRANALCSQGPTPAIFGAVSRLGDGGLWYALMASMSLADSRAGLLASLHLAATGAIALFVYKLLKRWTRRPRPFASAVRIRACVAPLDEFRFPSGHTLPAVAFTPVAVALFAMLAWLLAPFRLAVALSRVVL